MRVERILVDSYLGSYGPTLRVDVQTREQALYFRGILTKLVSGKTEEVVLREGERFTLSGLDQLKLKRSNEPVVSKPVYRGERDDEVEFVLVFDQAGWEECLELADALFNADGPGHQYLSREGY